MQAFLIVGLAIVLPLAYTTPSVGQELSGSETEVEQEAEEKPVDEADRKIISTDPSDVAANAAEQGLGPGIITLGVVIALFVVPTMIGNWLAKKWRMTDHGWKISLALGTIAAAAVVYQTGEVKLGPDLSGGITLIYELAEDQAEGDGGEESAAEEEENAEVNMDNMIAALIERVDPSGTKEVTIRKYGRGQVEIIIPSATQQELAQIKRNISTAGLLKFRITASNAFSNHRPKIKAALALPPGERILKFDGEPVARWVAFREDSPIGRDTEGTYVKRKVGDKEQVLILLPLDDGLDVTGKDVSAARVGVDQSNQPNVQFTMNTLGAYKFGQLTGRHLPQASGAKYNLGILIDDVLKSAPSINGRISSNGEISGVGTEEEAKFIAGIINAGSLPARLNEDPISEERISPTLGAETIRKGKLAIGVSLAAVVVFMLLYYRFAGFVACLALGVNLLLILGTMVLIKGAFTLPGLAGLVLTVGMSVDANVLIFERIREELGRGAALRMAIRNGFARATQTIVDANITTLITAIVIYKFAPDSVKGFGVTLILGIIMSMYTAIFLSRLVFDIAEKLKYLKGLSMGRILGETAIDFLGKRGIAAVFSAIVIGIGIFGISGRGTDLLNIDFTGGTSVTMVLDKPMEFSEVKALLDETELKDKNMSLVSVGEGNTQYRVTSVAEEVGKVQEIIKETIGDNLRKYNVDFDEVTPLGDDQASTEAAQADSNVSMASLLRTLPVAPLMLQVEETAEETAEETSEAEEAETTSEPAEEEASEETSTNENSSEESAEEAEETAESGFTSEGNPFENGTSAVLTFSGNDDESGVSYDSLMLRVNEALEATGHQGTAVAVSNDEYLQNTSTSRGFATWEIKLALPEAEAREVLTELQAKTNAEPVFPLANKIGGRVAGRMSKDAIAAIVISLLGIIGYIWFRFQRVIYGLAAVVALVHDVAVTLGVIALTGYLVNGAPGIASALLIDKFQISLPIVAAFLTIIGYSLNDTIVVFDRIREVKGKSPTLTREMINESINQTLSRTLLTSLTTLLTVLILYFLGGDGIHGFAFALVIGVLVGTYSSIFIASPALLWMSQRAEAAAAANRNA
ncbi:MAG: protein translocase subunit SecD [Lacipirellulaceae bacterium]